MIVLDASAGLELILNTSTGGQIAERISDPATTVHAPELIDLEVAQVLRRYVAAGQLYEARAGTALADFLDLDLERYRHTTLLPRIWALRGNLTAYDAAYVALAEALDAPLLTCDTHLARAPGHRCRVEVVG